MNLDSLPFSKKPGEKQSEIPGMTSLDECNFLSELAKSVSEGVVVEIGSFQGKSTIALAQGSAKGSKGEIFAIEPHEAFTGIYGGAFGPKDRQAFYYHVAESRLGDLIRLVSLPSHEAAKAFNRQVGLLWIDGDHSLAGVTRDFENWSKHLTKNGVVAFDDATDPNIGPFHLIDGLLKTGSWREGIGFGKIRTIKRSV